MRRDMGGTLPLMGDEWRARGLEEDSDEDRGQERSAAVEKPSAGSNEGSTKV